VSSLGDGWQRHWASPKRLRRIRKRGMIGLTLIVSWERVGKQFKLENRRLPHVFIFCSAYVLVARGWLKLPQRWSSVAGWTLTVRVILWWAVSFLQRHGLWLPETEGETMKTGLLTDWKSEGWMNGISN
jgi:hypothetical protein